MFAKKAILKMTTGAAVTAMMALPQAAAADNHAMPGEGTTMDMARASWDTGWWQAEIYSQLFEALGFDVSRITTLDNPPSTSPWRKVTWISG